MAQILLVEDEANARKVLSLGLETQGHDVTGCGGPDEAAHALQEKQFDLVLTDLRMDGRDAGLEVVRMAAEQQPQAQVLLLTAYASAETAVEAMREGAFDYLTKPVSSEELAEAVERALSADEKGEESPVPELGDDGEILIGHSISMQRVRERLLRAGRRDFTVLITGESGTGKELAARFLHKHSARKDGPFVPVHCGAIPEGLFESELFGHRKGSFTGADNDRAGLIESANGGTLFLDEIGEMPAAIQVKLLRVLQERRLRRVGDDAERDADVRVVAATNRDLAEEVQQGRFREDLFYRLNVVPVHMPPLRQRREDIPELVGALLQRAGSDVTVTDACMERLAGLPLMGNVRELENLLYRLTALSEGDELDASLLNELYAPGNGAAVSVQEMQRQGMDLDQALEQVERSMIEEAMQASGGNATQAAKQLGITFRSMRYRLRKLGMKDE
jgi:two-component system response regulator PilR (NtrC family)